MQAKFWIILLGLGMTVGASAQVDTSRSPYGRYYFEGDEVVFEFDRRAYTEAAHGKDSLAVDFFDLGVVEVVLMHQGHRKTKEGWVMQRVDENHYQLRKALKDFKDAPNWQFKFLINGEYWITPDEALKKQGALGWYDLKNPDKPGPIAGDTGNVVFTLKGFTTSKQVILAGSFNGWDEHALPMKRTAEGWELHLTLKPGVYEYKFIADGQWLHDPVNPEKRHNEYDGYNSVMRVTKPVLFELAGFRDAQKVLLAGSFTDWEKDALRMHSSGTGWKIEVPLVPGKHTYKFIVDDKWITDPANPRKEEDGRGNTNSVLFVR